jgi:murein DD-endopeptidase MepM/ murein hydrolase activator NlpD
VTATRPWLAGFFATIAAAFLLISGSASAAIGPGGAPTPAGGAPPPASPTGKPAADSPSAGTLSLLFARTTPRKSFYFGVRNPSLRYAISSDQQQNDLRIDVVDTAGEAVFTFYRNDVEPNVEYSLRWDGRTATGRPARNGRYRFRIQSQVGGAPLIGRRASDSTSGPYSLGFAIYGYAFPLLGAHDFGGSGARFGAARSGHTHQGHDVMARCGVPIVAARGGRVQYSGWDGAAGNYVVIDGKGSPFDTAYMHLLRPSLLKTGMLVRTGQPIGVVGSTGSSTACHLHFEMWGAPGWYEGGSPVDPLPFLLRWDRYS